ncbi:type II toxin-antitoxin system RelE/ParE family toxin [Brucella sp. LJL56]
MIAASAEAFPLVPRYEKQGIRRKIHGNYLIFYRVDADQLVVVHILHGARDYAAIIPEN